MGLLFEWEYGIHKLLNHLDTLHCRASETGFFEDGELKKSWIWRFLEIDDAKRDFPNAVRGQIWKFFKVG